MADRTLTVKVLVDDSDVDKARTRTARKLEKVQIQSERAQRNAARASTVASAAGVGFGAASLYMRSRTMRTQAFSALRATSSILRFLGRGSRFFGYGTLAAGAIYGTSKVLGSSRRAAAAEEGRNTELLLTELVRQSTKSRQSLETMEIRARQSLDPLGRGMAFHRARADQLGLTPRVVDVEASLRRTLAKNELLETQQALRNRRAFSLMSELGYAATRSMTLVNRMRLGFSNFQRRAGELIGGEFLRPIPGTSPFAAGARQDPNAYSGLFGQQFAIQQRQSVAASQMRFEEMTNLRLFGRPNVLQPAPTFSGEEAGYRARVMVQRRQMQSEIDREYNRNMLDLLRRMVEAGEASTEQLTELNIRITGPADRTAFMGVE